MFIMCLTLFLMPIFNLFSLLSEASIKTKINTIRNAAFFMFLIEYFLFSLKNAKMNAYIY